jgi:hypothetical protein
LAEKSNSDHRSVQVKRDRTLGALLNIIKTRARIGFSTAVVKSAYAEVIINGGLKERFGENHYAFAVRMCTAMVDRWRKKHNYTEPVQYIFDRLQQRRTRLTLQREIVEADKLNEFGEEL